MRYDNLFYHLFYPMFNKIENVGYVNPNLRGRYIYIILYIFLSSSFLTKNIIL